MVPVKVVVVVVTTVVLISVNCTVHIASPPADWGCGGTKVKEWWWWWMWWWKKR